MNSSERDNAGHAPPKPPDPEISIGSVKDRTTTAVGTAGEIFRFSMRAIRGFKDLRHYPTEVFHQAGVLVLSSGLVIWFMQFVVGTMCATEASYTLKQVGAPLYSGVFADY